MVYALICYVLEGKAIITDFLWPTEILMASKEFRTFKYSFLQALLVKDALDTWQIVKLFKHGHI